MHKILFIDEEKDAHDDFLDYIDNSPITDIKAEVMFPLENIEVMINAIITASPDAIVVDYRLNEFKSKECPYNVPYNGVDLVNKYLEIKQGYPCFVMTTFAHEAVSASDDVNIVYVKNALHEKIQEKSGIEFLDRVKHAIKKYQSKIEKSKIELNKLVIKRNSGKATISDENRLIELDSFLEKSIDSHTSIPNDYKKLSNEKYLLELLEKTEKLIKKMEIE